MNNYLKKATAGLSIVALAAGVFAYSTQDVLAASADTSGAPTDVNIDITETISISCDASETLSAIATDGQSTLGASNQTDCNIETNNTAGFKLDWSAATTYLENATSDQIAAYSPAVADTPEEWTVAATVAEWGGRVMSTSDGFGTTGSVNENTVWGTTDSTYGVGTNWVNVGSTIAGNGIYDYEAETDADGYDIDIEWGVEVGNNYIAPTGTYDVDVTFTATTL